MNRHSEIIANCEAIIQLEMQSIQLQKKLIEANITGQLTLHKIIVKDARSQIEQSRAAIYQMMKMKSKYEAINANS